MPLSKLQRKGRRCQIMGKREREQEQRESETKRWKQRTGSRVVSRWKVNPSLSTGRILPPYLRQRGVCSYLEICTIVCFKDLRDASNVYIINYFRLSFWFFFSFRFQLPTIRHVHLAAISIFRQVTQAALTGCVTLLFSFFRWEIGEKNSETKATQLRPPTIRNML